VDSAQPVTGPADITATHLRAFMSHLLSLHKPATANNRYRGLQQWFRWMASEDEVEYSPFAKLSPPTVPEEPVPVVPIEDIRAVLATCKARTLAHTALQARHPAGRLQPDRPLTRRQVEHQALAATRAAGHPVIRPARPQHPPLHPLLVRVAARREHGGCGA